MIPRLAEINYTPEEGLTIKVRPKAFQIVPEATMEHVKAANKELLLAFRSIIDQAIEYTEEKGTKPRRRVRVQVGNDAEEEGEEQAQ